MWYTFPNVTAVRSPDELEPQRVLKRLPQPHVAEPQTRLPGRHRAPTGSHRNRFARIPLTHFFARAQNKQLDVRRLRRENDAESEQHVGHGHVLV